MTTMSPTTISSTGTSTGSSPPRRTRALRGASSARDSMDLLARLRAYSSSAWPRLNRNSSTAPSAHRPMRAAPIAATSMRKSTSNFPRIVEAIAVRNVKNPPKK